MRDGLLNETQRVGIDHIRAAVANGSIPEDA